MREYIDYNDTLREGTDKLNKAIDRAYDADETATQAKQDVDDTLVTVNDTLDEVNVVKDTAATLLDEVNTTNQQVITLADDVQDAVDAVDQLKHVGEYNAGTTYVKNNVVTYNGSSYFAKQETTGNVPTNTAYWGLLAQRGVDGEGAVASVNGMFPDLDGNVEIDIPDVSGLATKAEVQAVEGELVAHKADEAAHGIGNKATLLTNQKSTIVGAVNELFTNVSNGKSLVGGAITDIDDSVVIPTEPTFNDLATAIGQISMGKKWASGITTTKDYQATVVGLPFKPNIIVVFQYDTNYLYAAAVYLNEFIPNKSAWISSGQISMRNVNSTKTGDDYVVEGEFKLSLPAFNKQVRWICFE